MMVSAAENLPLGILTVCCDAVAGAMQSHVWLDVQIVFLVRVGNADVWSMLSTATSWWSLGMSIGKIVFLKNLLPYRSKQACGHVQIGRHCARWFAALQARKIKQLEVLVDGSGTELRELHQVQQTAHENVDQKRMPTHLQ